MIKLKDEQPLPAKPLLDDSFDLRLHRDQQCSGLDKWEGFAENYPSWGMPYALPGLSEEEFQALESWMRQGAKMANKAELDQRWVTEIQKWEGFLNGDTLKERLMSRYIYEHWFLAHIYFRDLPQGEYFKVVRSRTPPGQPIDRISTRQPFDDPGIDRVYYRLWREPGTILAKSHMPYALDDSRMEWITQLFLNADYEITELPGYQPDVASNPFISFEEIPVNSRWIFMLQESRFTIMNFIKGPVCRGQVALDVINDQFWVFFVNPEYESGPDYENFLATQVNHLTIPDITGKTVLSIEDWEQYAKAHEKYLQARNTWINQHSDKRFKLDLNLIWDGDGSNRNAALTIFRQFDSASVVHGLVGEPPKTAWVIDYAMLERIHYLLVAGFDVYGNSGHQLNTRLYMDFLRMEGEFNFLELLPESTRESIYHQWYKGASASTENHIFGKRIRLHRSTDINFQTDDPKSELFELIKIRLSQVLEHRYELDPAIITDSQATSLKRLNAYKGRSASFLPQATFLTVNTENGPFYYSVLHNNAHSNITSLFSEKETRIPNADSITVAKGFIGAYPDAFWMVDLSHLDELVERILSLDNEEDYRALMDTYGVRRTDRRFWAVSDQLHDAYRTTNPIDGGLFDFNRLENR